MPLLEVEMLHARYGYAPVVQGVSFSQNVQKALGTILQQVSTEPSVYKVELLFSFKGIKRVEVPEERIHRS